MCAVPLRADPLALELGDSAKSKFDSLLLRHSLGAQAIYELWYALSNVLAQLSD